VSILPVADHTLCYGSADGGTTVLRHNEALCTAMDEAGRKLNLAHHLVKGVAMYGPGDIEAHLGTDGKFYLLDFGRVMPPEAPSRKCSRAIFYNLLRPEFVASNSQPLSSDAFSNWGVQDSKTHNAAVVQVL
jgi:Clustered mitochondria